MFVTVSTYLARIGDEDAIIALHEDWEINQRSKVKGFLSGELLRESEDSNKLIAIMHFENREAAQTLANDSEYDAWRQRLVSLTNASMVTTYTSEWRCQ
jgi:heme-degrading monooxygenase HmoA